MPSSEFTALVSLLSDKPIFLAAVCPDTTEQAVSGSAEVPKATSAPKMATSDHLTAPNLSGNRTCKYAPRRRSRGRSIRATRELLGDE